MASLAKRLNVQFTAQQVLDILMSDVSEGESTIDSENGGMLSGEESDTDNELEGEHNQDSINR